MARSKFNTVSVKNIHVSPQNLTPFNLFTWLGLDLTSPAEQIDDRRSPYAKNFRLYANPNTTQAQTQQIAISKRPGHSHYTTAVGQTVDQQITSTTGAADQAVGKTNWFAQKFTAGATGRLTRVDLNLKNNNSGTGPVMVAIYTDSSGPLTLLATSSILGSSITSSYQYLTAHFMGAPAVTSGTSYWVVAYIQSNGSNDYKWSSTTSATTAMTSTSSGNTWASASFALNLKTYVATDGPVLGIQRFYTSNASPVTLLAHNTNVYTVNDATGAVTSIKSGLSSSATFYEFTSVANNSYWVNGVDAPQLYNGSAVSAAPGSPPTTSCSIVSHVNRLFYLQSGTNYMAFTDAGTPSSIGATSFLYVPSPSTADPVFRMFSYQGNLVFMARNTKWVLRGTDLATFQLSESTAKKGAVCATACCKDETFIYFLSDDGHVYAYNGSVDTQLSSQRILPITLNAATLSTVVMYVANKKLFISYRPNGASRNTNRLVFDLVYKEWLSDENTYTNFGISLSSQTDTNQLVVGSSLAGLLFYGETGTNDVGKPIDFEYRTKYYSFGQPAAKHRIKRYYPFLSNETGNYSMDCQIDIDNQGSPTSNLVSVNSAAHLYGDAGLVYGSVASGGSGLIYGNNNLPVTKISVPGSSRRTQFRFVNSGVDEPVGFEGMALYIQMKRPV